MITDPVNPDESVTFAVNVNMHGCVPVQADCATVPAITPVDDIVSPDGNPVCPVPVDDVNLYGPMPPVTST